ncbi:hypothetical protein EMCRGX_G002438 [Ephydatia muelleri]
MGGKLEKHWLGVYIIQKDLGKGRNCLKTLEGKPLKQTIHCARLKHFLDPVVDDNIVDEVEELDNSDSECAGEQEAANGKNAELDLQQVEYALSKDIDVSLWIDFQPLITARSEAFCVTVSEYLQLLNGDCIGDNVPVSLTTGEGLCAAAYEEFCGLWEPEPLFMERHELAVTHSISQNKNCVTMIQIMNLNATAITVLKGEMVGKFHSVDVSKCLCVLSGSTPEAPFHHLKEVKKLVENVLDNNVIEPSNGSWANSVGEEE